MSGLISTKKVAEALHVSPGTVRAYARSGLILSETTPSGRRRFDLDVVRAALDARVTIDRSELRSHGRRLSVGRPADIEKLRGGPRVNFAAPDEGELALEIRALADHSGRESDLPIEQGTSCERVCHHTRRHPG